MIVLYRKVNNPVFDHWEYHSASHETVPIFRNHLHTIRLVWSHKESAYEMKRATTFASHEHYNVMFGPEAWEKCIDAR